MTDLDTTVPARARPNRRLRRMAVTASAALAMTLVPTIGTAGAITFTDPDDRCLPDAEAPPAPVTDRDQITPIQVPSVDCVFAQGISVGMTDNTYGPFQMTTRGQMATFIVRALEAAGYTLPAASDQGFTDIAGNTHEQNIQRLAAAGITSGKTQTTYAPGELVQRDQMASFLVQAAEYAFAERSGTSDGVGDFMAVEGVPAFPDVTTSNTHYQNVNTAALVLGLADGRESGQYNPDDPVLRQQMASFLVRLVDLTLIPEGAEGPESNG